METKNEQISITKIVRLSYASTFSLIALLGCGEQVPQATTENSLSGDTQVESKNSAVQTDDGQFAKLVQSITDLACNEKNADQLIYVKTESKFYYCDNASFEWTSIDLKGKDGQDGVDGIAGKDGSNGKDGVDGQDGAAGSNGTNGNDGNDGIAGVDLLGTYAKIDYNGSYILNGNSNQNLQTMTLAVFSDGSYSFSASVLINGTIYNPTFWVGADKAQTSQSKSVKVVGSLNRLEFQFPSGADMLSTVKTAIDTQGNSGQSISVGARLYTNGSTAPSFLSFPIIYEW